MGSTFVRKKDIQQSSGTLGKNRQNMPIYIQFVPGHVIDVVTSYESATYSSAGSNINSIIAVSHVGKKTLERKATLGEDNRYFPLFRGIQDVPTKGDPVLLCSIGGVNYYLGPVNSNINNPNFNRDHLHKSELSYSKKKGNIETSSPNFIKNDQLRLQKFYNDDLDHPAGDPSGRAYNEIHGDLVFEGRHGNSIRIGSRQDNPYIYLSNGRGVGSPIESTKDGTLIAILEQGTIRQHFPLDGKLDGEDVIQDPFLLASDNPDIENERLMSDLVSFTNGDGDAEEIIYQWGSDDFPGNQLLQTSDRIIINSRSDSLFLSSFSNIHIGSGKSLTISTNAETIIESSNIYLGKKATEENEPLVLGEQLKAVLEEIIDAVSSLKVSGVYPGISGPPDPGTTSKLSSVKSKVSKILSSKHFIDE